MTNAQLVMVCLAWLAVVVSFGVKAWQTLKDADAELEREEAWYAAYERRSRRVPDDKIDTDAA